MARALADIEQDILALSDRERVELLRKLIGLISMRLATRTPTGIGSMSQSDVLARSRNGTARTFPADDVLKEARTLLK